MRNDLIPTAAAGIFAILVLVQSAAARPRICDVDDYGAQGDGATTDTRAIQGAIDECGAAGGGVVRLDNGGVYATGTLTLRSGITLHVAKGTTLRGTRNKADYPATPARRKCERCGENLSLLWAEGVRNLTLTGGGTIDGNDGGRGNPWGPGGTGGRPRLIRFFEVESLTIRNLSLIRSASWTVWLSGCDRVLVDSLSVNSLTGQGNQDGLDIDDCKNMVVRNSEFTTGDDAICFKSMRQGDRIENVLIENIVVHRVTHAAVKMGTESHGGMRNVLIRNVRVVHTGSGALGLYSVDGAVIENVAFEDIVIERADNPICVRLGRRLRDYPGRTGTRVPGSMKNIAFRRIKASGIQDPTGSFISGTPGLVIDGVTLEDIDFTYRGGMAGAEAAHATPPELEEGYPQWDMFGVPMPAYGLYVRHARNLVFRNVRIVPERPDSRPGVVFEKGVEGIRLEAPVRVEAGPLPAGLQAIWHREDGRVPVAARFAAKLRAGALLDGRDGPDVDAAGREGHPPAAKRNARGPRYRIP